MTFQVNCKLHKAIEIIKNYFKNVFDCLSKLKKIFGFNLYGYVKLRIYTFLVERYLPFWFKKYTKYKK